MHKSYVCVRRFSVQDAVLADLSVNNYIYVMGILPCSNLVARVCMTIHHVLRQTVCIWGDS